MHNRHKKFFATVGELIADSVAESESLQTALEGGNCVMTNKTKQELMDEIKELNKQIENLKKYEEYKKAADEAKAIHIAFMDAGFTEEQAFDLIKTAMMACVK